MQDVVVCPRHEAIFQQKLPELGDSELECEKLVSDGRIPRLIRL